MSLKDYGAAQEIFYKIPNSEEMKECPVCKTNRNKLIFHHIYDSQDIVQCEKCKLVFLNSSLQKAEWLEYIKKGLYLSSQKYIKNALARLQKNKPGKLLDIGCGNGEFLYQAQKLGWDVTGVELFEGNNLYNLPVKYGIFEEMDLPENYFDIVTFWGVTEYLIDPLKFFEKVKTVLKNSGKILFVMSNYYSVQRAIMKVHNFPRQQLVWSMPSIKFLFEKVGLRIIKYDYRNDIRNGRCTELITFLFKKIVLRKTEYQILLEHNSNIRERGFIIFIIKVLDRIITIPLSVMLSLLGYTGVVNITAKKI
ncbi:MAG: class I SAM-dependent methyltransferase [Elusimicrobiota bacterium]